MILEGVQSLIALVYVAGNGNGYLGFSVGYHVQVFNAAGRGLAGCLYAGYIIAPHIGNGRPYRIGRRRLRRWGKLIFKVCPAAGLALLSAFLSSPQPAKAPAITIAAMDTANTFFQFFIMFPPLLQFFLYKLFFYK